MKKLLSILILCLLMISLRAQRYDIISQEVCWNTGSVDSSLTRYFLVSTRASNVKLLTYLNATGQSVDVSGGGSFAQGHCGCCGESSSSLPAASSPARSGLTNDNDTLKLGGVVEENTSIGGMNEYGLDVTNWKYLNFSASDSFKIITPGLISAAVKVGGLLQLNSSTGRVEFTPYGFPGSDGTNGQYPEYDASGDSLKWTSPYITAIETDTSFRFSVNGSSVSALPKYEMIIDSIGQLAGKLLPEDFKIVSRGKDGKGEATYYVRDSIPGLTVDSLGQYPVGNQYAVLDELLEENPTIHLSKLGVSKGKNDSDLAEKYINAFPYVTAVFPNDTLQLLDIYIDDNSYVNLHFENTTCIIPDGSTIDIIDDTAHVFNFKNVDNIIVSGAVNFDHSDTSRFDLVLPPKWNDGVYRSNQIFHIESGSNWQNHGKVSFNGVRLTDSWYNMGFVNTQVPEHSFTERAYDLVEMVDCHLDYGVGGIQSRGNIGLFRIDRSKIYTDQYKLRWTSGEIGRTGPNQEVTAINDMKVEILNSDFYYEGFFLQNAQDITIDNCTFNKYGYWNDRRYDADSIMWNLFAVDSLTAEQEGRTVRMAGGSIVKIDHAIAFQSQLPRSINISRTKFRNTRQGESVLGSPAINLLIEGESIDANFNNCIFDDVVNHGGSPGFARAPSFDQCTFTAHGQVVVANGFTMNHCVFRDSTNHTSNASLIDRVDTIGTWESSRLPWRSTGSTTYYPVKISNTNFYSRTISTGINQKGYYFDNCGFYDYSGIVLGEGTITPSTERYDVAFRNCIGGRIRVPLGWDFLTDSAYIDIINHKDLLVSEQEWEALINCPSCDINNVDVLDFTNGVPHDRSAYRADLSAQSLVKDYFNYDDSLKINKQLLITERSNVGDVGQSLLRLEAANANFDTLLSAYNGTYIPFVLFNDGKFQTIQNSGNRTQFWGSSLAVTSGSGSITTWTITAGTINAQFSNLRVGNGSAGSPGFTFYSDGNTGMYRVGTDHLGFSTGGILGLQINASQHLLGNGRFFDIDNPSGGVDSLQATIDSIDVRLDELETKLLPTSQGTSATTAGAGTTLIITHNLGQAPTYISLTPGGDIGDWYVNTINSTTMTLNYTSTATTTASSVNIYWQVE